MNSPAHAFDEFARSIRRVSRTNLYLAATLVSDHARLAVTVRNLSSSGALVRSPVPLREDGPVTLIRGSLRAEGTMAWTDGQNGGIHFDAPIDLAAWTPCTPQAQRDVDRMVAQSRGQVAPLSIRRGPDMALAEWRTHLATRIAEELAFAARRLETIGSKLADDPAVIARHSAHLLDLDITSQVLGHLTGLLSCDDPEDRLSSIGMEDLRRRLERAPLPN